MLLFRKRPGVGGRKQKPLCKVEQGRLVKKTKRSSFWSQHPGPYLPQHHDDAVGTEEAGGVSLIQAQSRFHGQPGPSPEILFH